MFVNVNNTQQINNEVQLGKLIGADLNTTSDQLITLLAGNKKITKILVVNASGTITLAVGGFYTGASKTGSIIVANSQAYSALTSILSLTTTLIADYVSGTSLYFSLTTANGVARTCDIYLFGNIL